MTRWLLLGCIVLLVSSSLACALDMPEATAPTFIPPSSSSSWTPTPTLTSVFVAPLSTSPALSFTPTPLPMGQSLQPTLTREPPIQYFTQAGDTLPVLAVRFGVDAAEILAFDPLSSTGLLPPNRLLLIPRRLTNTTAAQKILPDSEVIFSPSAEDFDIHTFVQQAGGYLSTYREYLKSTGWTSGADVVMRVARENSINPRLLLALLEYQSGSVYGQPANLAQVDYPMGYIDINRKGLYLQLAWAVNQISIGYYGWREGLLTEVRFSDGVIARLAPELNAGTVALQYYLTQVYDTAGWLQALDVNSGLPALYERMFGSPWLRALDVEPLYPPELTQPKMILPFFIGQMWSYTGGPHGAWEHDGARAAVDFAPAGEAGGCSESTAWVLAPAPGLVVRTGPGLVVIDLDGDGREQTGWSVLLLHVATKDRIAVGDWVDSGDLLGHPSCEGGQATGVHVHIARKYNGEWIPADGPVPFVLSGWTVHAGAQPYEGTLTKDGEKTVVASIYGSYDSRIVRTRENP